MWIWRVAALCFLLDGCAPRAMSATFSGWIGEGKWFAGWVRIRDLGLSLEIEGGRVLG